MKFNRIALYAMLFTTLCLGGSFKAWADDFQDFKDDETYGMPSTTTHDFIKHRAYIGFFGTSADIDNQNDFNGFENYTLIPSSSADATDTNYIPLIDRNFGWAAMAGYREGAWALELSYWYSNHNAYVFSGVDANNNPVTALSTTATYSTINLDLKRYFLTSLPIQPFALVGMNFSFLSSHNTSELIGLTNGEPNGTVYWSGDQTESGFGLNLGVGAELYLGDGLSVEAGAIQRFTSWGQISGAAKQDSQPMPDGVDQGNLEGNGINFFVGGTIGVE